MIRFASPCLVALLHDPGWTPARTLVATRPPFQMGLPEREALRAGALPPPAHHFGALRLLNSGWSVRGRTFLLAAPLVLSRWRWGATLHSEAASRHSPQASLCFAPRAIFLSPAARKKWRGSQLHLTLNG